MSQDELDPLSAAPMSWRTRAATWGTLGSILLIGLFLRVVGIEFGLPHQVGRPDEQFSIRFAQFFEDGLDPGWYSYPAFFMYFVYFAHWVQAGIEVALGRVDSIDAWISRMVAEPWRLHVLPRWISAVMGTLSIWVTYLLARKAESTRTTSMAAAALLSMTYLHVRDSHYATTDVPATLFATMAAWLALRARGQPTVRGFAAAGALAGLAAATKYNAGLSLLAPLGAAALARAALPRHRVGWTATTLVAALAAFAVATPFCLLRWGDFFTALELQSSILSQGQGPLEDPTWWRHLSFNLRHGIGVLALALSAFGTLWLLLRRYRAGVVLLVYPLLFFGLMALGRSAFTRYMVPVLPFVCVTTAVGAAALAGRLVAAPRWRAVVLLALLAGPLGANLRDSLCIDRVLARDDTRVQAGRDLLTVAGPGRTIAFAFAVRAEYPAPVAIEEAAAAGARVMLWKGPELPPATGETFILTGGLLGGPREELYPPEHLQLLRNLEERAEVVTRRTAWGPEESPPSRERYDRQDLFYLPFADPCSVERMGPVLTLYRLVQ